MQRVEGSARIAAPPAEVFAYLADLDNLAEWQSGVLEARRLTDGEIGPGTKLEVTRELMSQRLTAPLTVTEYEPPHLLVIGSEVSNVRVVATLVLDEADGGSATDLAFAMEIRGSGFTSFMEPVIASAARKDVAASLERVAKRFEAAPE